MWYDIIYQEKNSYCSEYRTTTATNQILKEIASTPRSASAIFTS